MQSKGRLPNLIIPGAAKSGTSSLFHLLGQHPEVFMPRVKEPMYFVSEHIEGSNPENPRKAAMERNVTVGLDAYCELFVEASGAKIIGEGSVSYLYYWQSAIPRILDTLGDVSIILMLRNPVDRAFSSYKNVVKDGHEPYTFEDALALEEARAKSGWSSILYFYRSAGLYSDAVRAYQESFSRVKVILFDDFKADTSEVLRTSYEFLKIDPAFEVPSQRPRNSSLQPRNNFLKKALFRPNRLRSSLDFISRPFISEERKSEIILKLKQRASKEILISPKTRDVLKSYYSKDLQELERIIDRDLSRWR